MFLSNIYKMHISISTSILLKWRQCPSTVYQILFVSFFLFFAIIREQKMSRIQEMSVNLTSTDHEDIRSLPKARVNVTDSRIHNMANNPSRDNFAKVVIVNKEHQITYCCHP